MEITSEEKNGATLISLIGRMDATTVKSFEEACTAKLSEGAQKVVIDLAQLEYISSAGLRGILMMEKASRAHKATIVFCSMQKLVAEVFKISGFNTILKIFPNQEEAFTALS